MSVSESGFYKWLKKPESKRIKEEKKLTQRIKELFEEHKGFAGSPMITRDLRSEEQFSTVGKNRVARIMKENNLKCKSVKKYRTTTDSRHNEPIAENLLNRQFNVSEPNKVWVGDITYFKIHGKWYYLSIFIDLFSRITVLPNKISDEQGLFKYIEIYYNRRRRHSSNNWISPADHETQWWNLQKAA